MDNIISIIHNKDVKQKNLIGSNIVMSVTFYWRLLLTLWSWKTCIHSLPVPQQTDTDCIFGSADFDVLEREWC